MSRFIGGDALVIEWIHSGGTAILSGQYRKVSVNSRADVIETTSGTASHREYAPGLAGFVIRFEGMNNGTASILGTAHLNALAPRTSGTVRLSPHGTASGQPRWTGAAIVTGRDLEFPYDELATVTIEWRGSGALAQGVW
jgi:hypothetical protein